MAASGVQIKDEVTTEYNNMKTGHKYSYIIYKISDDFKSIEVEKKGDKGDDDCYEEFKSHFPANDCRYGVCEIKFSLDDGGKREKLAFFAWTPDTAKIKSKMLYASSKDALKKKLVGHNVEIQATEASELLLDDVIEKLKKK